MHFATFDILILCSLLVFLKLNFVCNLKITNSFSERYCDLYLVIHSFLKRRYSSKSTYVSILGMHKTLKRKLGFVRFSFVVPAAGILGSGARTGAAVSRCLGHCGLVEVGKSVLLHSALSSLLLWLEHTWRRLDERHEFFSSSLEVSSRRHDSTERAVRHILNTFWNAVQFSSVAAMWTGL